MGAKQNPAKTLTEKIWGSNFFDSVPAKWKSALRVLRTKIPGVPNNTDPDVPVVIDADNLAEDNVVTSQVTTNRTNELEKVTERIQASLLLESTTHGQELDTKLNVGIPFTEHLALDNAEVGDANKEIEPLNPVLSVVKEYDLTAVGTVLDAYSAVLPGRTRIEFPPVMTGASILPFSSSGSGNAHTTSAFGSWSGSGSFSLPIHQEAQLSQHAANEFVESFAAEKGNHRYLATKKVVFFLASPVTEAAVLSKLTTILGVPVTDWPNFNPQEMLAVLTNREGSMRVTADYHYQDGGSSSGAEHAEIGAIGYSIEVGMVIKTVRVRPSIHGALFGGGATGAYSPSALSLTATASSATITQSMGAITADYVIYNVGATPGATSIPASGVRLLRTESELYKYGYVLLQCEVFDFANL